MKREDFDKITDIARGCIPAAKVSWAGSPWAWMLHNGPNTKNALGRKIAFEWATSKGWRVVESDADTYHLSINGSKVAVHFATLGKEGQMRFSAVREPDMGVDSLLLIGVEPRRVRFWQMKPAAAINLKSFQMHTEGYHTFSFKPDSVPGYLKLKDEVLV